MKHLSVYVSTSTYTTTYRSTAGTRSVMCVIPNLTIFPNIGLDMLVKEQIEVSLGCKAQLFAINELKALVASKLQLA